MKIRSVFIVLLLAGCLFLTGTNGWAAELRGVTDKKVKIACLSDLSGPAKYAGIPNSDGIKDYFAYVNAMGGINGRSIDLIIEDNGLLPTPALTAARKVILKDEVLAIVFNLGSASTSAILPLCEENQVVLMPHGANKRFYSPGNKWVFVPHTVQFSMASRAVEYILGGNPKARIGIIYQDDDFGIEGLEGARSSAIFMKTHLVRELPYKTGTVDFSSHMRTMKEANVDFIVLWTYIAQTGAIAKERAKMGWDVPLISNNTHAIPTLFGLVGDLAEGILFVTPWVPVDTDVPGIKLIKEINKKYGKNQLEDPTYPAYLYVAAMGYAMAMAEGIKNGGRDLNPETLVKGIESIRNYDMGGAAPNMTFGPKRHVSSFSSMVLKADAKNKKFLIIDSIKEPKTPQD